MLYFLWSGTLLALPNSYGNSFILCNTWFEYDLIWIFTLWNTLKFNHMNSYFVIIMIFISLMYFTFSTEIKSVRRNLHIYIIYIYIYIYIYILYIYFIYIHIFYIYIYVYQSKNFKQFFYIYLKTRISKIHFYKAKQKSLKNSFIYWSRKKSLTSVIRRTLFAWQ